MGTPPREASIEEAIEDYIDQHDWEQDKAHCQNTSQAVRRVVRALVDTGSVDEEATRTVYNLCQNDDTLRPTKKKERVENLNIDAEAKAEIKERIEAGTGIVGAGTYSVPVEGYEDTVFDLFSTAINSDDRDEIDAAIEEFAAIGVEGVQNGILSPILYFLHPTKYPISNDRSRTGMQQLFGYEMSGRLTSYLEEVERFQEVREEYPFEDDFRHLDSFFNWAAEQGIESVTTGEGSRPLNESWQQIRERTERAETFIANPSRESLAAWIKSLRWPVSRHTDTIVETLLETHSPEDVAQTFGTAAESGDIEDILDLPVFGITYATEALATIDPDAFIPLNKPAVHAFEALNVEPPKRTASEGGYAAFLEDVETLIHQYDLVQHANSPPAWATEYQIVAHVFQRHDAGEIDLSELTGTEQTATNHDTLEIFSDDAEVNFYWVNQHNQAEIEDEYLRAKTDGLWHHKLDTLSPGDVVFHNFDNELVGISRVTGTAETFVMQDEEYYRLDVDLQWFDTPIPVDDALKETLGQEEYRTEKYYPLNKHDELKQAYLADLSQSAAAYLLDQADVDEISDPPDPDTNYFWISANPSIWKVDSIDDGGEVFYTAYNQKGNKRRIFSAFEKATPGDKVLFYESQPVQAIVAEGEIVEGLHVGEAEEYDEPVKGITITYNRPIDEISWEQLNAVPDLDDASPLNNRAQGSLFELSAEEYDTILALEEPDEPIRSGQFETLQAKLDPISINFDIPDTLYFENASELRREIEASLNSGKHIIFTGPPGTGKTKLAKEISRQAVQDLPQVDGHTFTTATSEWTAFDTIGGYVPSTNTAETEDELQFQPRLILNSFRTDTDGIVNDWLVIDEINRSDIDKAFGQLFSVLSGDSVELPYERQNPVEIVSVDRDATDEEIQAIATNPDVFPVTPAWRLLATMNTYDKASLYEMSYAFMRRFNFIHVGVPDLVGADGVRTSLIDPDADDNYATAWVAADEALRPVLEDVYREMAVLWKRINDERVIGPSIVHDIIQYLVAYDDITGTRTEALTSAVISLVYPQLEGLRPERQKRLIRSLTATDVPTEDGTVNLDLDAERLEAKAADFFGIGFDDDA